MGFLNRAFEGLYPGKEPKHNLRLVYSGRFKGYNANVKYTINDMTFNLSRQWKEVDEDIQIGLIQSLLNKVFGTKNKTMNIDLYNSFLKNVHVSIPVTIIEPELQDSFKRINKEYFDDMLEPTNLKWSQGGKRTFGTYEYGTDTISINPILQGNSRLMDYVMYHEMLHKKFKFKSSSSRSFHHTKEFRDAENVYPEKEILEKELNQLTFRGKKKSGKFFDWFSN